MNAKIIILSCSVAASVAVLFADDACVDRKNVNGDLSAGGVSTAEKPIFVVNEDNDHYFKYDSSFMTKEALEAYVDDFSNGHVTHFFMCPSGQRPSYDTKAPNWEPIWAGLNEPNTQDKTNDIWCVNTKKLHDTGIDPYHVWIARCRKNGISPWFSIRMNDGHFAWNTNYFRNTTFYKTRRDLRLSDRIIPASQSDWSWYYFLLDFEKEEVRDYTFGLIKEQLDNYDLDGYELDFMRFCHYFKIDKARECGPIMTEFVRKIRRYADEVGKKKGRRIKMSVRVPFSPNAARDRGLFAVEWAKEGSVDWIAAACGSLDYEMPLSQWEEELKGTDVVLLPANDFNSNSFPFAPFVQTERGLHYGWANTMYSLGAKGLYLFNIPYSKQDLHDFSRTGLGWDFVKKQTCRYRVGFHCDISEDGLIAEKEPAQLPRRVGYADVNLLVMTGKHENPSRVRVALGFAEANAVDTLKVSLNGCEDVKASSQSTDKATLEKYGRALAGQVVFFDMPASAVKDGLNIVQIKDHISRKLIWCEIEVTGRSE